jgi:membrane-associated phospholipid phosphatase
VLLALCCVSSVRAQTTDTAKTFFTRRDAVYTGAAIAGTAALSAVDLRVARWTQQPNVQGCASRHRLVDNLTKVNETTITGAAIITYGIGRIARSSTTADVALHTAEATVLTSVVSQLIRGPLGRVRPSQSPDDQYRFQFGRGFSHFDNRSFPSLHSASAFAAAAALSGEIRERDRDAYRFAAPVLYAAAAVPGMTRLYLHEHWLSDVAAGAFIGTLLGSRVVHYAHTHRRNFIDRTLLATVIVPDGQGGVVAMVRAGW